MLARVSGSLKTTRHVFMRRNSAVATNPRVARKSPSSTESMTKDEVLRKKIAYRSAQRSMREVELVLRAFNRHYVARLSYDALLDFNDLLANENISDRDLYSWITGAQEPNEEWNNSYIMLLLKECFQIYTRRLDRPQEPADPEAQLAALRKRVKWRSSERGTRENELILRSFCAEHLDKLDMKQLQQFERLLSTDDVSDPDLYKFLTGAKPVPPELAQQDIYKMLAAHVSAKNLALKGAAF